MTNLSASRLPSNLGKELGYSGTYNFRGFITGEEYNRNLIGRQGLEQYDIMRRSDGTTHAALEVCKRPLLGGDWSFQPASTAATDVERADFLNREFMKRNIDFFDVMREGLSCLEFGHALAEICYDLTTFNGQTRIGLKKIASRKQRSVLRWEMSNGMPGITQVIYNTSTPTNMVDIPMQKLVVWTNEKEGENYEGISLLRFAYKHWLIKDRLEMMNAVALEKMGMGIPYVKKGVTNETIDQDEINKVVDALRNIRINEEGYIEIPSSIEVGFLDMKGHSTKDILPTLQYEDMQILLSVLAQFLGLGVDASGSRALSQDHSSLFLSSLQYLANTMAQGFQSIANRLIDLNYTPSPEGYPTIVCTGLDDEDVTTVSKALGDLYTAGVITPGVEVENRARRILDIEDISEEDFEEARQLKQQQTQQAAEDAQKKEQQQPSEDQNKDNPKLDALNAARTAREQLVKLIVEE